MQSYQEERRTSSYRRSQYTNTRGTRRPRRRKHGCLGIILKIILLSAAVIGLSLHFPEIAGSNLPLPGWITQFSSGESSVKSDADNGAASSVTSDADAGAASSVTSDADPETVSSEMSDTDPEAASSAGNAACYFYSTLDEKDRAVYCQIYSGLAAAETSFEVSANYDEVQSLVNMVCADHPEIFWCSGNYTSSSRLLGGAEICPEYNCGEQERTERAAQIREAANQILADLPDDTEGSWEKARAIFDYLITEISYDANATDNQNIYSALVNHSTVCAGYARAAEYLLQQAGIEAVYISGTMDDGEGHAWNALKLEGDWYLMDATSGRSCCETEVGSVIRDPAYAYLCCTDAELYRDRRADLADRIPVCNAVSLEYYRRNGHRMESCDEDMIRESIRQDLEDGDGWSVQFGNEEDYQKCLDLLNEGLMTDVIRSESLRSGSLLCRTQYDDILYTVTCLITEQ